MELSAISAERCCLELGKPWREVLPSETLRISGKYGGAHQSQVQASLSLGVVVTVDPGR